MKMSNADAISTACYTYSISDTTLMEKLRVTVFLQSDLPTQLRRGSMIRPQQH